MQEDTSNPRRWERIEQIYHAALPLGTTDRQAFVADRYAGDVALHRRVQSVDNRRRALRAAVLD